MAFIIGTITVFLFVHSVSGLIGDGNAETVSMPNGNNWVIGTQLTSEFQSNRPPAFTAESMTAFTNTWNAKVAAGSYDTKGTFDMSSWVSTDESDWKSALNIDAKLSVSYMAFSGDASMNFAKNNMQSSTDASVTVTAKAYGQKAQLDIVDLNALELDIDPAITTMAAFTERYGTYMIVGFGYGGEIRFDATLSARSSKDHEAVGGALKASYGAAGFTVSGSAKAGYSKDDISKSTHQSWKASIRPNVGGADVDTLIGTLIGLAFGNSTSAQSTYKTLMTSADHILSGQDGKLDELDAVVVALSSIKAVADKFADHGSAVDEAFMSFLNNMYIAVMGAQQQMKKVMDDYQTFDPSARPDEVDTWNDFFTQTLGPDLHTVDVPKAAVEWNEVRRTVTSKDPVLTAKSFLYTTVSGFNKQFATAVLEPYQKWVAKYTGTKRYMALTGFRGSWTESRQKCKDIGGDLASITNADEFDASYDACADGQPGGGYCYIGLNRISGSWAWTDGSLSVYTHWNYDEPDLKGDKLCAIHIWMVPESGWSAVPCDKPVQWDPIPLCQIYEDNSVSADDVSSDSEDDGSLNLCPATKEQDECSGNE